MNRFEFPVAKSLSLNEGQTIGFFGVQARSSSAIEGLFNCTSAIRRAKLDAKCIGIMINEYAVGESLAIHLAPELDDFGSFATFGTNFNFNDPEDSHRSHLEVVLRETGSTRPDFLSVLLDDMSGQPERLQSLHLRFGSMTVTDSVCVLEATDELPRLTDPFAY